jgi:hypothetical protein
MSATETQPSFLSQAERRRAEPAAKFLHPTLAGVGIGTASVGLLAILMLLMALAADTGGRAVGTDGEGAGRGDGAGFGASAATGSGGGKHASAAETIPGAKNTGPADISNRKRKSDADTHPHAEGDSTKTGREDQTPGLSSFKNASPSNPPSGDGSESQGGGSGFSDVGDRLDKAGAKGGDVQISLAWNNGNDLDLHVIAPSGERICFNHRNSKCNGELDVDMNSNGPNSQRPVENVYWPAGRSPAGEYRVQVQHFANQGSPDPTAYQIIVKVGGRPQTITGQISHDGNRIVDVHRFTK